MSLESNKSNLCIGEVYNHKVIIPGKVLASSRQLASTLADFLGAGEAESSLASYWSLEVRRAQWRNVLALLSDENRRSFRCLEVGCGLGLFVCVGNLLGFDCIGVEPGEEEYQGSVEIARQFLQANGLSSQLIRRGRGEILDFDDNSFDTVCSFQNLEHVKSPERMLGEIERVLKPGGMLLLQCPNYRYPYDGHYGLILPSPLGKKITKFCLRLYRRPTQFLDHLNFVTPGRLCRWLQSAGFSRFRLLPTTDSGGPELPVEVYPLPFKFTRGIRGRGILSAFLRLTMLKQIFKVYPQITLVAWKTE